jgi:hypothetical protein
MGGVMTAAEWWAVGSRLLGLYFIVMGAVTAAGALMMLNIGLPDGLDRSLVVAVPLVQGAITVGAGIWLVKQSGRDPLPHRAASPAERPFERALQLLGLFFLIEGLSAVLSTGIDASFVGMDWQTRAGQLSTGLVYGIAGGAFVFVPEKIAEKLHG